MSGKTAIYERVSSKTQDTASQKPDLQRWEKAQEQPAQWYSDKFTGKTLDRKGWNQLWAAVERGEVTKIVIWRLDRLGRTAAGLTRLFEDLIARKVTLVSVREGFDLLTPAGRLMANMLASVAQYETEVRSERQLAGIAAAKAAGKTWGGSEKGRLLKVKPEQLDVIRTMHKADEGVSAIARATGLSRPTIYSVIDNHL